MFEDNGLMDPASRSVDRCFPKFNVLVYTIYLHTMFYENRHVSFWIILFEVKNGNTVYLPTMFCENRFVSFWVILFDVKNGICNHVRKMVKDSCNAVSLCQLKSFQLAHDFIQGTQTCLLTMFCENRYINFRVPFFRFIAVKIAHVYVWA